MEIALKVSEDMRITASQERAGHQGDHNFTRFNIERPARLEGYVCRADIRVQYTPHYLIVTDDTFAIPNTLSKGETLEVQLVYTDTDSGIVVKTDVAKFKVGRSIDAVDEADAEFQDGLAQLVRRCDGIESAIGGITTGDAGTSNLLWLPSVDEDGNISWERSETDEAPATRNITGPAGPQGEQGVQGLIGVSGADGYTPQKGVDYFTDADKDEIAQAVLAAIPVDTTLQAVLDGGV